MSIGKNLHTHRMAADSKTSEYGCRRTVLSSWKELAILSIRLLALRLPLSGLAHPAQSKEGPYQDRPLLCPFRLLPLLTCSGSTIAFLKIQGPKSKKIENTILLQP